MYVQNLLRRVQGVVDGYEGGGGGGIEKYLS